MHKKIALCFLLVVLSCLSVSQAQTSFGFRFGYSSSSITYFPEPARPAERTAGIIAPTFAFVVEHFGQKNAGIVAELQYLTLGFDQVNENELRNITEWQYVKMPILSNFYMGRGGRFHIKLGPHFGYMLSSNDVQREFEGSNYMPPFGGPDNAPNKFMYGLTGGVGLSKLFGKSTIEADLRYSYEFGRQEALDRIFDMNSTNIELTLTYVFQFLKRSKAYQGD